MTKKPKDEPKEDLETTRDAPKEAAEPEPAPPPDEPPPASTPAGSPTGPGPSNPNPNFGAQHPPASTPSGSPATGGPLAEEHPTTPLGALRRLAESDELALGEDGATMLVAYLRARDAKHPGQAPVPVDPVAFARELRRDHPQVWKALGSMNFVGLSRAVRMAGLHEVDSSDLQEHATKIRASRTPKTP